MTTDRFYSYDPDDGFSDHSTAEDAQAATERVLEDYRDAAEAVLEWSGDVAQLHWGRLLPLGSVAGTEGTDDDGEPWTHYHLAAQPDELAQLRARVAELEAPQISSHLQFVAQQHRRSNDIAAEALGAYAAANALVYKDPK